MPDKLIQIGPAIGGNEQWAERRDAPQGGQIGGVISYAFVSKYQGGLVYPVYSLALSWYSGNDKYAFPIMSALTKALSGTDARREIGGMTRGTYMRCGITLHIAIMISSVNLMLPLPAWGGSVTGGRSGRPIIHEEVVSCIESEYHLHRAIRVPTPRPVIQRPKLTSLPMRCEMRIKITPSSYSAWQTANGRISASRIAMALLIGEFTGKSMGGET